VSDTVEATIRDTATIEVECESCGHKFSYEQVFLAKAEVHRANPQADGIRAIKQLGEQLRSGFGKGNYSKLNWKRCPNCRYTQSWMIKKARITQGMRLFLPPAVILFFGSLVAVIIIPDPRIGGQVLKYSLMAVAILPIVAVISMSLVFRPNRGRTASRVNRPGIVFGSESLSREEYLHVGNMPGDLPRI